jgi:pimeloyl-ACP methyl ester carboxylesterase
VWLAGFPEDQRPFHRATQVLVQLVRDLRAPPAKLSAALAQRWQPQGRCARILKAQMETEDSLGSENSDALVLRLRDGRVLGYAEQGAPAGVPVLFFHGRLGSRLSRHPDGSIARRLGIRLITFDRPGIGLSAPQPKRRLVDWPRDIDEFADARGLDRFAVIGWSAGAPYALATAHELPDRVTRLGLVSPLTPLAETAFLNHLAPPLRRGARLGRRLPWLVYVQVLREARAFARDPEAFVVADLAKAPACDRAVLDDPSLRRMLIETQREAYRQGASGVFADALLGLRPWGFEPADVRTPVRLWHGEEDKTLATPMGRHLAAVLPDCEATFVPGEGHMLCLTHWEEIIGAFA